MRLIVAALLAAALCVPAQDENPCVAHAPTWNGTYYVATVPHDQVALGHAYTASPPAELITQHYDTRVLTFTTTITVTTPPPPHTEVVTYTTWTFKYSETMGLLGYTTFIAHVPDYAYFVRSPEPFQLWECGGGTPYIFFPLINRPTVN